MTLTFEPPLMLAALDLSNLDQAERRIVSLIPAHNEQDGIVKTVLSQFAQSVPPTLVIVMADNCTDRTVELALSAGAQVVETVGNRAKKAGALNQGLEIVMPLLREDDYILSVDADGELSQDFLKNALQLYDNVENVGGLSGAIVARSPQNWLEAAQVLEYARGTRLMSRAGGKIHVLSGAATLFRASVLRHVAASRGTVLPGERGDYFMQDSLTEDYELTLAIKKLGYHCSSTKRCTVVTDVMPTMKMLTVQRLRWYRGAMESLWLYGLNRLTWKTWFGIGFAFFSSLLFPLALVVLALSYALWGTTPDLRYTILLPIFMLESIVTARLILSRRTKVLAWTFVALWAYDNYMFVIYWRALFQALGRKARVWIT